MVRKKHICGEKSCSVVLVKYPGFPDVAFRRFIVSSLWAPQAWCRPFSGLCQGVNLVYSDARAYIYNVSPSFLPFFPFKKYALKHIYQSASYEKVHVNPQKKLVYILQMSVKALLLHPLSGTKAAMF